MQWRRQSVDSVTQSAAASKPTMASSRHELCFGDQVMLCASEGGVRGFIDATSNVGSTKLSLASLHESQEQPKEIRDCLFEITPKMVTPTSPSP